jgi:ribosomal protein S18 acetylase RimI-like enzyme
MDQSAIGDPASEGAQFCLSRYFQELNTRFETGFDVTQSISANIEEFTEPAGLFLVARLRSDSIGCGALKFHHDQTAEIKRIWVADSTRGLSLGRRLLSELEQHAADWRTTVLRLETNQSPSEAINLYRSAGYSEVEAFNDEPHAHHWFEKILKTQAPSPDPRLS